MAETNYTYRAKVAENSCSKDTSETQPTYS